MADAQTPPMKAGYLRGISDLLQSEKDILLSVGFVDGQANRRWRDIQVTVTDGDDLDARATDDPPRIWISSGLLLLTHEAMSLATAYLDGAIEVSGGHFRSAWASNCSGFGRRAPHGVIEPEWGAIVLRLGGRFADRVIDMTKTAVLFTFYHEFSHLLRTHHPVLGEKRDTVQSGRELRRFLEKDADFHAAQFLMQRLMAGPISLQVTGAPRQSLSFLEDALLAVGILFLLDDLRLNRGRDELLLPEHVEGRAHLHPLVRWSLVFVMLSVVLNASTHLHHSVPVTGLSHDVAERVLGQLGRVAAFFGFQEDRWSRARFGELVECCLREYDHWAAAERSMPDALRTSLDSAYLANTRVREVRMSKICIVTDVTETAALRQLLGQEALPWAEAEIEEVDGALNFSGDPVDATLITVAGAAIAAFCRSVHTFLRERKRTLTITSGEQVITINNLTAEEIETVLREAKKLTVARAVKHGAP